MINITIIEMPAYLIKALCVVGLVGGAAYTVKTVKDIVVDNAKKEESC